jgi:hypothetical protein
MYLVQANFAQPAFFLSILMTYDDIIFARSPMAPSYGSGSLGTSLIEQAGLVCRIIEADRETNGAHATQIVQFHRYISSKYTS